MKYALITGCSSGIGHATAIELSQRGYKVFACARRVEPMEDLREFGIVTFSLDVTDAESVARARKFVEKQTEGKLDILFNNAGQSCTRPAIDVTDDEVLQCLDVNFIGCVRMTREFIPLLVKSKGLVAFTGSVAGYMPFPWSSIYGASKAAIHVYANTLHLELKPLGVRVLNVVTGGVKTNIAEKRPFPENSIYYCQEAVETFEYRREMAIRNNPMSPETYAKKVVDDMLNEKSPAFVYRGKGGSILPVAAILVPTFILEYVLVWKFKLGKLFAIMREKADAMRNEA